MPNLFESHIEELTVDLLKLQGFHYYHPLNLESERGANYSEVLLNERLKNAIDKLNPKLPQSAKDQAFKSVINLPSQNLIDNNEAFHKMICDGVEVEYLGKEGVRGDTVKLIAYSGWLVSLLFNRQDFL